MNETNSTLLICTVGGSPEPVVTAIKQWQPLRVCFVHTPQTKGDIDAKIVPRASAEGIAIDAGRYHLFELPDGQDLTSCLDRLRQLTQTVVDWTSRGKTYRVVVDFTGGTKCMSASIGLQASRWPCVFSYVGGSSRTKDGVGIVVSGSESVVYQANPWDALGYRAVEDFIVLFDQQAFVAAARAAEEAMRRIGRQDRKEELSVLHQLAGAFDAWDRFDHKGATTKFRNVLKSANNLRAALGSDKADGVLRDVARFSSDLDELQSSSNPPTRLHVVDLLANARRRWKEGRIDDAVARLYRAIEAIAQLALKERHGIASTSQVPVARLPLELRAPGTSNAEADTVMLGLQGGYALLAALGDALGEKFKTVGLDGSTSPLMQRNRSILAHGFELVPSKAFDQLWAAALDLAGVREGELPVFCVLAR